MSETPSSQAVPAASNAAGTSTRRSVLRTAAWTTPIIATAVAAPAYAASPVKTPGINGWIEFTYPGSGGRASVTVDARGTYPVRGLWINDAIATTTITNIYIVFHFRPGAGTLGFTKTGADAGSWSNLVLVGTITINGQAYNSYRSNYSGVLPAPNAESRVLLKNAVFFQSQEVDGGSRVPYIDRFVTINGAIQSFRRLIGGDGAILATTPYTPSGGNLRMAQVPAEDTPEELAQPVATGPQVA
ncbi:hypothetical protein [Pseudoclavibacter sp. JSM 162008]|uniref:hypothetical protein n=1 Tax=Pseudoclavibacter sp. JSM 162008 TaxID=3229855 RepID=UPI0035261031